MALTIRSLDQSAQLIVWCVIGVIRLIQPTKAGFIIYELHE